VSEGVVIQAELGEVFVHVSIPWIYISLKSLLQDLMREAFSKD
jgi:hypothetical protein